MTLNNRIEALLNKTERRLFKRLNTPQKIQDYLDTLPINFESNGETYMTPRRMLRAKTAHCFEGAVFAAAVLAYHGQKPLILDMQTLPTDIEHVVALFQQGDRWGAISKTNHAILRYRDPVYESVRELAMSYFHEYALPSGVKSMRTYSAPYDLSKHPVERWLIADDDMEWLVNAIDRSRHFAIAPRKNMRLLRKTSPVERKAVEVQEWKSQGKRA